MAANNVTNGSSKASLWMLQNVRSFWQGVNWENRPLEQTEIGMGLRELSFKMSVGNYFSSISWTGKAAIAQPTIQSSVIEDRGKSETLDDFIEDISQFF
jgi:hypothetical protein